RRSLSPLARVYVRRDTLPFLERWKYFLFYPDRTVPPLSTSDCARYLDLAKTRIRNDRSNKAVADSASADSLCDTPRVASPCALRPHISANTSFYSSASSYPRTHFRK